jgi:uncharacterized cupin superfamily protein
MRRLLTCVALLGVAITANTVYRKQALATPASGFTATTIAVGRFSDTDVLNHFILPNNEQDAHHKNVWLSLQKIKGLSDVYVQNNVFAPGGTSGWHTHPGHSLIIVAEGTITAYDAADPECKPTVYTQGMGFVDSGGEHVHNLRNEGTTEARTIAVQLIPADATRRIDAERPAACTF